LSKQTPLGEIKHTARNFEIINFKDRYHTSCSLQQSSLAESEQPGASAVWLGVDDARMHIDLKQAKALVAVLEMWIETGRFAE